jgi:hypothetical protein
LPSEQQTAFGCGQQPYLSLSLLGFGQQVLLVGHCPPSAHMTFFTFEINPFVVAGFSDVGMSNTDDFFTQVLPSDLQVYPAGQQPLEQHVASFTGQQP